MLELGSILLKTFPNTILRKVSAPFGPRFVSECYVDHNQSRFISIQSRYRGKTKLTWEHNSLERKGGKGNRQENQYDSR